MSAPGKLGDARLVTAIVGVGVAGALLTLGSAFLWGAVAARSAALGAVTALSNLYVLSRIVAIVAVPYENAKSHGALLWGVIATAKIMVLFGGLWLLMTWHLVDPIPLVVGYGSLPIGIAIGAVVSDKTGRVD